MNLLEKQTQFFSVNGVKFKVKELAQMQSDNNARVGMLKREFADHPSAGLTPAKLAGILREAEYGNLIDLADLADDLEEKDAHIYAELTKRKNTLLTVPWTIEPPRDATPQEQQDAELIEQILQDMNCIDDVIFDMADGILKGFSNLEMSWHRQNNIVLPEKIEYRPQRWFMVNPDNQNELRLRDASHHGQELQKFTWIQHRHKAKSGYVGRVNLVRVLAWPFLFKNYSVRDLAEFLEIYGLPARIGQYPTGASDTEKASLLQAIMSIGHNAGGIIPKGMAIDFHNAASGQADPFELMISWCEKSQSKAILGSTLTSQADGKTSTNALGNVHNESRKELRDSDLRQVAATLTRDLVMPLYMFNGKSFTDMHRLPKLVFDVQEPEDLKLYADALPKLAQMGMKIPVSYAHEKLQIPVADEKEPVLGQQITAPDKEETNKEKAKSQEQLKASISQAITALKAIDEKDTADLFSDQLARKLSPQLANMVASIEQLVNGADSLEDLQAKLYELELPIDDMSQVMQLALTASHLLGQYEVEQGN